MYLEKIRRLCGKLAFRLTLWYAGIFTLTIFIALLAFYGLIASAIHTHRDHELADDIQEFATLLASDGIDKIKDEMTREALSDGVENIFLRLLSIDGKELAVTDMSRWQHVSPSPHALQQLKNGADYVLDTLMIPTREHHLRTIYGVIGPDLILQIGESWEPGADFLAIFRQALAPIMAMSVLVASFIGWFIARRALAGVEEVTHIAEQISTGAFGSRVPVKARGDEIERLATTFNSMLDRIDVLIKDMRNMSDNIAHDLRSPLARIRSTAEMVLTSPTVSVDDMKEIGAGMVEDCDRLLGMINTMLDIAEAESGLAEPAIEAVDLVHTVRHACDLFEPVAETYAINIDMALPDSCVIDGAPRRLQRLVANLLDNALKYTPPGGVVTVSLTGNGDHVAIAISDTGIGIADKDLPNIFKQFYRCDKSRGHYGSGLGLSLVQAIAHSHGGSVRATSAPGQGSTFTVLLPWRTALVGAT